MSLALLGIGVCGSRKIASGPVIAVQRGPARIAPRQITQERVEGEIARLHAGVQAAQEQLKATRAELPPKAAEDIAEFISAHLLILEDQALIEGPIQMIREQQYAAEWALQVRLEALIETFNGMSDPYLRTRKDDMQLVIQRIQKMLLGEWQKPPKLLAGCIALAHDLSPAETVLLAHRGVAGLVTETGGPMSHTAILARSLNIPALLGVHNALNCLRQEEFVVLDANNCALLADCATQTLRHYEERQARENARLASLTTLVDQPAKSADGTEFKLLANIELPEDAQTAQAQGADGIGLFRTEFLYMNREQVPSEQEQFEAYRAVIEVMNGKEVTLRTLDLGADKTSQATDTSTVLNPALGLRGIRLCLKEPDLFQPQLRALLRASAFGPIRILLPMLTQLQEVEQAKTMIHDVRTQLRKEGYAIAEHIPLGGMIEVPAAALTAQTFAEALDFLSIGTNDLTQYSLAIDRCDDEVNYLFDPLNAGVLSLIQSAVDAGRLTKTPVAICGELAAYPAALKILTQMGLRELSMHPGSILGVKQHLSRLTLSQ